MINSRKLSDLVPEVKDKVVELQYILEYKYKMKTLVIQTLRDAEYQKSLYDQGRSKKGKIVTNCDGVKSKSVHQSGRAVDIVPVDDKKVILWNRNDLFKIIADEAIKLGFKAGFYFKSLKDSPHLEM